MFYIYKYTYYKYVYTHINIYYFSFFSVTQKKKPELYFKMSTWHFDYRERFSGK